MALKAGNKKDAAFAIETEAKPDRSQCPPDEKVRALAKGEISDDKTLEQHVDRCEWCAREYKDHAKDLEWNRFTGRSAKALYLVIVAIVIFEIIRHFSK